MNLDYIPLLPIQCKLQAMPRNKDRFRAYLERMKNTYDEKLGMRTPLVYANPMAKEHVTALLDSLLQIDADGIAARTAAEAAAQCPDVPISRTADRTPIAF